MKIRWHIWWKRFDRNILDYNCITLFILLWYWKSATKQQHNLGIFCCKCWYLGFPLPFNCSNIFIYKTHPSWDFRYESPGNVTFVSSSKFNLAESTQMLPSWKEKLFPVETQWTQKLKSVIIRLLSFHCQLTFCFLKIM